MLGMMVRDRVTGFVGVCTAQAVYITGYKSMLIESNVGASADGKSREEWVDERRVVCLDPDGPALELGV